MVTKQVRTLEERICIIEEVEKTLTGKRVDIAKCLRLPSSTLNSIQYMHTNLTICITVIFTGIRIDHFPISIIYFQVS